MLRTNQTLWDHAEEMAAKFFGGERVKASGMGLHKSDVHQTRSTLKGSVSQELGYRIEVKSTKQHSLSIKTSWFGKISKEARDTNQLPALYFMFSDMSSFALLPLDDEDKVGKSISTVTLNDTNTSMTPEYLRSILWPNAVVKVSQDIFIKAGCGNAWVFPYWKVIEDK